MPSVTTLLLVAWAVSIGYFDWRYRRIPNMLCLGAFCVGSALLVLKQTSLVGASLSTALQAAGFGLVATLPAYLLRKLGAGDVKYLVAMGLLTSLTITIKAFTVAALLGAGMALLWLAIPWLLPFLVPHLPQRANAATSWLLIRARERRMAFGTLLSIGLVASLLVDRS